MRFVGCRLVVVAVVVVVVVVAVVVAAVAVAVVEYIIILIITIVEPPELAQLQMCPTVKLESSIFAEASFSHHKVMGRQIQPFVAVAVFRWPAG